MNVGTKNRLHLLGVVCKAHLREQHADKLALVEEFIAEIEGSDPTRWNQFTSLNRSQVELLGRVEAAFQKWLNPVV